jgi:hypothetical protein
MNFFIWKGNIFRVPITTLQSCKIRGGWELLDIYAKCKALLLSRMLSQGTREVSALSSLVSQMEHQHTHSKPSKCRCLAHQHDKLREYATDMPYVTESTNKERIKQDP